jgi:hypothetical protein
LHIYVYIDGQPGTGIAIANANGNPAMLRCGETGQIDARNPLALPESIGSMFLQNRSAGGAWSWKLRPSSARPRVKNEDRYSFPSASMWAWDQERHLETDDHVCQ